MKRILFLCGNAPVSLALSVMELLRGTETYDVVLVYNCRIGSPVAIPLSSRLRRESAHAVGGVRRVGLISRLAGRIAVIVNFVSAARSTKPDAIHAWHFDALIAACLATCWHSDTKLIFHLQDTYPWMRKAWALSLQRLLYRRVELLFVTAKPYETRYLRPFDLVSRSTSVVYTPNVPPAEMFADFTPRAPRHGLTVGYFGFFRGRSVISALVEGVRIARERGGDHRVIFAGVGQETDFVTRLARENPFVHYLGPYRHEEILELYGKIDLIYAIYEASTDFEIALAYRLCEAVNCRLPTLVGQGTHMAELVDEHGIGISVPIGDATALGSVIDDLYRTPARRQRIAARCAAVRDRFVFEAYRSTVLEAYACLWPSKDAPCKATEHGN